MQRTTIITIGIILFAAISLDLLPLTETVAAVSAWLLGIGIIAYAAGEVIKLYKSREK